MKETPEQFMEAWRFANQSIPIVVSDAAPADSITLVSIKHDPVTGKPVVLDAVRIENIGQQ